MFPESVSGCHRNMHKVMGTDGKWHDIKILDEFIPKRMFEIEFENGKVQCSDDHEWTIYGNITKIPTVVSTLTLFESVLKDINVGLFNGPKIISIKEIEPKPCKCIHILDSDDMLFEIITEDKVDINEEIKFNIIRN